MWQLENRTPFAAGQGWIRDRRGAETWLVVVKATFAVDGDGRTDVAEEQPLPVRIPEYFGEAGHSSVKLESDFVLTKTTTDILLLGRAHAPNGRLVRQVNVGLRVGDLRKTLCVFGDRTWGALGPSEPEPFATMPLVYERGFGGVDDASAHPDRDWDWRNPVGRGYAVRSAHLKGKSLPNIEAPDRLIRSAGDRPAPAGFGVVASHWQPRAALAGTYGAQWEATRQPLLPSDCDDRFFQCAPVDQQAAGFLVGGEPVEIDHVHPRGRIAFELPRMLLELETRFFDGERRSHEGAKLHSVILEPERSTVSLVWHSALECHDKVHQLEATRISWRVPGTTPALDDVPENLLELV